MLQPEQIEALASPVRSDLIDRLSAGGEMSVRELAEDMALKPSSLYHHLRKLLAVGLVEAATTRRVNRRNEQLYRTVAPRMRLRQALAEPSCHAAMGRMAAALARQADRDFASGLADPDARIDGPARNLGVFRLVGQPAPEALARINAHLDAIAELMWDARCADAPMLSLAWTMAPIRHTARRNRT